MKSRLAICLLACALLDPMAHAEDAPAASLASDSTVTGVILELKDVDSYTYMRLKTPQGETWAAVSKVHLTVGTEVSVGDAMVMHNFQSKSLKETFPSIVFGSLAGSNKGEADPHGKPGSLPDSGPIRVAKASGANAHTVADVITHSAALHDKKVDIHAQVVKFNSAIMGKNWIHVRDGSGSDADATHDLLVTTTAAAKVGDVVTVSGTVRVNRDFGAGYAYKVMIEDASLTP